MSGEKERDSKRPREGSTDTEGDVTESIKKGCNEKDRLDDLFTQLSSVHSILDSLNKTVNSIKQNIILIPAATT